MAVPNLSRLAEGLSKRFPMIGVAAPLRQNGELGDRPRPRRRKLGRKGRGDGDSGGSGGGGRKLDGNVFEGGVASRQPTNARLSDPTGKTANEGPNLNRDIFLLCLGRL